MPTLQKKVFSATQEVLLNKAKQLMCKWNQIGTQKFDGMARSQETARWKLQPSFETPENAMMQGNDNHGIVLLVDYKPFSHQNLISSSMEY